jgi:ribosome maturation protein SDO1
VARGLKSIGGSQADIAQEKLTLSQPSSDPNPMSRVLFSDEVVQSYGSRCLDGSPSGYYFRENAASTKWVIFLQGGGLCVEPEDCLQRSKSNLGSSKSWAPNYTDTNNVLGTGDWNPLKDWNHVFVPYGSGDVWTGQMKEPTADGLYFAGHNTVNALLDHLENSTSFSKASFILLSGGSAGGIGAFHNADFVSSRAKVLAPAAVVKASPQAGFYFPSESLTMYPEFTENVTTPFPPTAAAYLSDFFHGPYLDASCTKGGC